MAAIHEIRWRENDPAAGVRFALGLLGKLRRYARAAAPREICGVVIAERRSYGLRIRDVKLLPNVAADRVARFEIETGRLNSQVKRLPGDLLWGLFHTHTLMDARPSRADLDVLARYGTVHVILSTEGDLRIFLRGEDGPGPLRSP